MFAETRVKGIGSKAEHATKNKSIMLYETHCGQTFPVMGTKMIKSDPNDEIDSFDLTATPWEKPVPSSEQKELDSTERTWSWKEVISTDESGRAIIKRYSMRRDRTKDFFVRHEVAKQQRVDLRTFLDNNRRIVTPNIIAELEWDLVEQKISSLQNFERCL